MRLRSVLVGACALMLVAGTLSSAVTAVRADDAPKLPVIPADNPVAPFIDSENFAIAKGATAEWRKMEGVAIDAANKKIYVAITAITKGMSDKKGDIQLAENPCGAVLVGDLDENMNVSSYSPLVVGGPYDDKNDTGYKCDADHISNPDNIFVDGKGNLWIGEDTDFHKNQMLWMWNGKELKRFATQPSGAEVTGLKVGKDGTLFLNVQHPSPMNVYPFNKATIGSVSGYVAGDDFTPVAVPEGDAKLQVVTAAGSYNVIARAGDAYPMNNAVAILGEVKNADGTRQSICNNPDGNMFLPINDAGTEGYLYTNFECTPGGVSMLYIKKGADGWAAVQGQPVDFSGVNGTWNNCNASVTPWNTAMTSEEYPADVQDEWEGGWLPVVPQMTAHLGKAPNPFDYGYAAELTPVGGEDSPFGTQVVKHYAMGRVSWEQGVVMPDQKTVYGGNDGTNRVMFKFVADAAGDLSAGTLYAAKITQDGEKLNISWIELGKGKDADILAGIRALDAEYAK